MNPLIVGALAVAVGVGVAVAVRKRNFVARKVDEFWTRRRLGESAESILSEWAGQPVRPDIAELRAVALVDRGRTGRGLDLNRTTADGRVTPHWGQDISAYTATGSTSGAAVYAAKTGVVVGIEPVCGYGNTVQLSHLDTDEESTVYAHLQWATVGLGQIVEGGAEIGRVGNTTHCPGGEGPDWAPGQAAGMAPHLHFEVHPRRVPSFGPRVQRLDPVRWLAENDILAARERA